MVRETALSPAQFMYPLFIVPGKGVRTEIASLPGQYHLSVDQVAREAEEVAKLGIPSVLLFGLPEKKDDVGSEAWHPEGAVQRAIRAIKKAVPELVVAADACFCEYTSHGHCGVILDKRARTPTSTTTPPSRTWAAPALSYAQAGATSWPPPG